MTTGDRRFVTSLAYSTARCWAGYKRFVRELRIVTPLIVLPVIRFQLIEQ